MTLFYLLLEYLLIGKLYLLVPFVKTPNSWKDGINGDVILVQGFAENFIPLKTIADHLNKLGYKIHVIPELDWQFFSVEQGSKELSNYIQKQKLTNVILLSHSKGGLVAKQYINKTQGSTLKYAITIAAPYHGTIFGHLKIFSLSELIPGSNTIQNLLEETQFNSKIINLYSTFDNHVIPNQSLILEQAKNIQMPIIGHTRILESAKTLIEIDKYLTAEERQKNNSS